ncbi:hypothetical protein [Methylobacterium sp. Leaf465]|uniref:hypothetical protein n=1 Tax=Methylobacterium sp. Leaf465 TaxID=1736385 RepID=UPI001AEBC25F|nr:hypothetical protein [Methylobacterium sp. Leaf465]
MAEKSISFRSHLQSNTTDLLDSTSIPCTYTVRLVISLVSRLAAYTEEGVPLAPSVFICNSVSQLVQIAGAGEHVALSNYIETADAAAKILKAAAPLCSSNWRIYVERSADGRTCKFGVFCGSNDPSSLTVEELALSELDPNFPIVRISQSITNKVEVSTSAGSTIEFRFNDDADVPDLNNKLKIRNLAISTCRSLSPVDPAFQGFMERVLTAAIRASHGTLIAVVSDGGLKIPPRLSDAVALAEPLDLYLRYRLHHEESKTAVSVSRLQSAAELLSGFINSDGITVVNSTGKILGYRAFIKSGEPNAPSDGGARTRAFVALSELIGNGLDAAFFRSQDGRMELSGANEGALHA